MKKWALIGIIVLLIMPSVNARLFSMDVVTPDTGCSVYGCIFMGDINMNGYTIYNATFVNATVKEFDPIFTAENSTIWGAINGKLDIIDQRYNDTLAIQAVNDSLINYLLIDDQRYNDTGYINNLLNDYYNKTESDDNYYPLNNPNGFINETKANNSYYPLNSNPAGYINTTDLGNLTNNTWVLKTGDTMTGPLNMSNQSIWDVDVLSVHNITGRSPIYINSPMISYQNITAENFYGNINGQNGTIFGMTIINGTITNMHVSESALFNTSLLPEMNNTWNLGEGPDKYWHSFYVAELYAGNISSPDIDLLYNITDQIIIDLENKLNITDQRYNDTILIGIVNDTVYSLYNLTTEQIYNISLALDNKLNISDQRYNDTAIINAVNTTENIQGLGFNTTAQLNNLYYSITNPNNYINSSQVPGMYNDSWIQPALDLKLNESDQRYNDTGLITAVNDSLINYLTINDQRYNDTALIYNLTQQLNDSINNISLTPGPQGIPGINGTDGVNGTSINMTNITDNGDGTYTWYFSDGTNYTTSNLTGAQGQQGIPGINSTTFNVSGPYLYNINDTIYFNESPLQQFNDTYYADEIWIYKENNTFIFNETKLAAYLNNTNTTDLDMVLREYTGANLTGSSGDTNRLLDTGIKVSIVNIDTFTLQPTWDYTTSNSNTVVTFLNKVWNDQIITIYGNSAITDINYLGSAFSGVSGTTGRTLNITNANTIIIVVDNFMLNDNIDYTFIGSTLIMNNNLWDDQRITIWVVN